MRPNRRVKHKIKVLPSGKRVRIGIAGDRVIRVETLTRARMTKSRRRLQIARRRLKQ